jgi:hypothetical protein
VDAAVAGGWLDFSASAASRAKRIYRCCVPDHVELTEQDEELAAVLPGSHSTARPTVSSNVDTVVRSDRGGVRSPGASTPRADQKTVPTYGDTDVRDNSKTVLSKGETDRSRKLQHPPSSAKKCDRARPHSVSKILMNRVSSPPILYQSITQSVSPKVIPKGLSHKAQEGEPRDKNKTVSNEDIEAKIKALIVSMTMTDGGIVKVLAQYGVTMEWVQRVRVAHDATAKSAIDSPGSRS